MQVNNFNNIPYDLYHQPIILRSLISLAEEEVNDQKTAARCHGSGPSEIKVKTMCYIEACFWLCW